jgi:hypothetical protein
MPTVLAETLDMPAPIRSIPIVDNTVHPLVGLVYPQREPMTPLTAALVTEARRLGMEDAVKLPSGRRPVRG